MLTRLRCCYCTSFLQSRQRGACPTDVSRTHRLSLLKTTGLGVGDLVDRLTGLAASERGRSGESCILSGNIRLMYFDFLEDNTL
jgi:hypothetical protein